MDLLKGKKMDPPDWKDKEDVEAILKAIRDFEDLVREYEPYALAVGITVASIVLAILILSMISVINLYVMFYKVSHIRRKIKELTSDDKQNSQPSSKTDEFGVLRNRFSNSKDQDIETVQSFSYEEDVAQLPKKHYSFENERPPYPQPSLQGKAWPEKPSTSRNPISKKNSKKSDDFY